MADEVGDLVDSFPNAGKRAAPDRLVGDEGEEAFDLAEPTGVRWGKWTCHRGRAANHAFTFACLWVA